MPIEGRLEYQDNGEQEETPIVRPGRSEIVATFMADGEKKHVLAFCQKDDNGGLISIVGDDEWARSKKRQHHLLNNRPYRMRFGGRYERVITTESKRVANLVLRHTFSSEPQRSMLQSGQSEF